MKRALLFLSVLALPLSALHAGAGASAVNFLLDNLSARLEGMGGLSASAAEGTDSFFGNPAGLALTRRPEIQVAYASGQELSRQGFSGYAHPLRLWNRSLVFGSGINYYDAGNIDVNSMTGPVRSVTAETGLVGAFSAAYRPMKMLAVGVTPKLIRSTLVAQYSGTSFATDFGALVYPMHWLWGERFTVGLSIRNLGSKIKYKSADNDLPLTQSFGIAGRPFDHKEWGSLLIGIQEDKVKGEKVRYRLGGEYAYGRHDVRALFLRAGGFVQYEAQNYVIGFGFRERNFELDYSFTNGIEIDRTHRMSVVWRFGTYEPTDPEEEVIMPEEREKAAQEKEILIKEKPGTDHYYILEREDKNERDAGEDKEFKKMMAPEKED